MNRSVVRRAAVASALLGALVGVLDGWGAMQPMGLVAGGLVGYSVSRVSDAIFDGLLAGFLGGTLGLVLVVAARYAIRTLGTGDAAAAGQQAAYVTVSGLLFVPGAYAVGALLAAPLVVYAKPHVRRVLDREAT